ncbi:guanylin-like [Saccopteryx leptura]|uniref:guanylin-like n=1 Tax=Saccopteryx leptura TaxID=249018 RepID=UPI00339C6DE7
MNTFLLTALCLLGTWAALAQEVTVPDEEFSFPLELVTNLQGFWEVEEPSIERQRRFDWSLFRSFCDHPDFPEEIRPLCKELDAQEVLQRLKTIAKELKIGVPIP